MDFNAIVKGSFDLNYPILTRPPTRSDLRRPWTRISIGTALLDTNIVRRMTLSELYVKGFVNMTRLRHVPIRTLSLDTVDMNALKGMPISRLYVSDGYTGKNLDPLEGMPLYTLVLKSYSGENIDALKGMNISFLDLREYGGSIRVLHDMPLETLTILHDNETRMFLTGGWLEKFMYENIDR